MPDDIFSKIADGEHPGVHLDEYLQECGFSHQTLANALRVPLERIDALIAAETAIDADMALRLAAAFDQHPTAEFWMTLQAQYDLAKARSAAPPANVAVLHRANNTGGEGS